MNISIVGSGFAGLQTLHELKNIGFTNISLFERNNDVGGIWVSNQTSSLKSELSSYLYRIPSYPVDNYKDLPNDIDIIKYLNKFLEKHDCKKHILLNCEITEINRKKNLISYRDKNDNMHNHHYDYLIDCTGKKPINPLPKIEKKVYKLIHSSKLDTNLLGEIHRNTSNKDNVLLIGGGKSSMECAYLLHIYNIPFIWTNRSDRLPYTVYHSYLIVSPIILLDVIKEVIISTCSKSELNINIIKKSIFKNNKFNSEFSKGKNTLLDKVESEIVKIPFFKYKSIDYHKNNIVIDNHTYHNIKYVIFATGYTRHDIISSKCDNINSNKETTLNDNVIDFYNYDPDCFGSFSYPIEYYIVSKTIANLIKNKVEKKDFCVDKCLKHYTVELRKIPNILRILFNKKVIVNDYNKPIIKKNNHKYHIFITVILIIILLIILYIYKKCWK